MFREIFGPPGLKAGQNDTRIEDAVPQPKGGGVAARLSGYESETERAAVGRELALDDCRPMDLVVFAEALPAGVIIAPRIACQACTRPSALHSLANST
jgi:hypothetical protein